MGQDCKLVLVDRQGEDQRRDCLIVGGQGVN